MRPFLFLCWKRDHNMSAQIEHEPLPVVGGRDNPLVVQVWRLAEPLCLSEGLELVHVEFQREPGGRTLRLYLDKPGGVTLKDCETVSRQLSDILDIGLETDAPYRLEVSSPGLQRPLGKIDDFERFKGRRAKIRTARAMGGQKNFSGTIEGLHGGKIQLTLHDRSIAIAFADIVKAQLITIDGENQ